MADDGFGNGLIGALLRGRIRSPDGDHILLPRSNGKGYDIQSPTGQITPLNPDEARPQLGAGSLAQSLPQQTNFNAASEGPQQFTTGSRRSLPATSHYYDAGGAPDPSYYAKSGENLKLGLATNPFATMPAAAVDAWGFRRGGINDAQHYGGNPASANYDYGVHTAAEGLPLGLSLFPANQYAKHRAHYGKEVPLSPNYPSTPIANVENIKAGFDDYNNRTLWQKPK